MIEHYVTLFDSSFLPQGLALHRSMMRHAGEFKLWIIAMDQQTAEALRALDLSRVTVLDLAEVETPSLLSVKDGRTRGEYCWTLTPFSPSIVFDRDSTATRVTYLDADIWFVDSPRPLFDELESSGRSVLITDHSYSVDYDQALASGRFCVQFMPFTRDSGQEVLTWWQDRVIEWCFARYEDGKFGDQKYLDDWPERFGDSVHVLQNEAATQAPWNAQRFDPDLARLFHFHELRTMTPTRVRLGHYRIPKATIAKLYRPYLDDLAAALETLRDIDVAPPPQKPPRGQWQELKDWLALRVFDRRRPRSPLTYDIPSVRDEVHR